MQPHQTTTPYEVLCPRCSVTFPVGSRQCIHCGGRLGRGRTASLSLETPLELEEAELALEEEAPRRSPFSPVAILWALLFVGVTIHRACTSG